MLEHATPPLGVLFVCLGNICRSPLAEGAFREAARQAGLECTADSAGTASYHIGSPPDDRAIAIARANGVDIAQFRGRQLGADDFYRFSHIFALDTANLAGIKAIAPRDALAETALLMDVVEGREGTPVKDPYYGDESDFADVWDEVALAADALVARLRVRG